jgi:hypothetical protein
MPMTMTPSAAQASRVPSARPRRSDGNSSTTIVTAAAYSAPRNTRASSWKAVKLQMSQLTAVSAVISV